MRGSTTAGRRRRTPTATSSRRCASSARCSVSNRAQPGLSAAGALLQGIKRVFILGPSHHVYLRACCTTGCEAYDSPFGPMAVDAAVTAALGATGHFQAMSRKVDEAEHSLELHLPFVAHLFQGRDIQLVPILVGALTPALQDLYGEIFAPYLDDPANFFVISTDFCHWGARFDFISYDKSAGPISSSIEALDRQGMYCIAEQDAAAFTEYIAKTGAPERAWRRMRQSCLVPC